MIRNFLACAIVSAVFTVLPVRDSVSQSNKTSKKPDLSVDSVKEKDPVVAIAIQKSKEADSLAAERRVEREKQEAYERYIKEEVRKGVIEYKRMKAENARIQEENKRLEALNDTLRQDNEQFRMIVQELNAKRPDTVVIHKPRIKIF